MRPIVRWLRYTVTMVVFATACHIISGQEDNTNMTPDDFSVRYTVTSGPELGAGITEGYRVLVLDSSRATGFLELHHSSSDDGGPIGTFRAALSQEQLDEWRARLARVSFDGLPAANAGGPGTSSIRIAIQQGKEARETLFSNRDVPILEALADLIEPLDELASELEQSPEAAILVEVLPGEGARFVVRISNVGTRPLRIMDPRALPGQFANAEEAELGDAPGVDRWAGVRIAELPDEEPGFTSPPLEWFRTSLQYVEEAQGKPLELAAGQQFEAQTVRWRGGDRGKDYLVQAVLSDYRGVGDVAGSYRVRGAASSVQIEHPVR